MKKSLLALAAMSAFAGAAQAQSSVTVYGIVDVGFTKIEGVNGAAATTANGAKTTVSSFNSGNLSTSRLGFRGVEDLGGGTRASFVAEIGLAVTGNGFSGSSNMFSSSMGTQYQHNSNAVDNRQTFLGLGQKGLGEVRIGRQYTPVHEAMCAQNAGGCNGIAGDMIYSGANSSSTRTPANGIGTAAQIRASNSITYRSDNIQGFQVTGLYSANNTFTDNSMTTTPAAAGSGAVNYRMSGGNIVYTGVKNLDVRFGSQITAYNRDNAAATTTANVLLGNQAFLATPATLAIARTKERDQYAGVSYDFGVAKLALQQVVLEVEQLNLLTIKKTSNQVAVTAPVSKALNAWASYGQGNYRSSTSAREDKFSGYQAGTRYMLSKRTSLYAIYGAARQDAVTAGTTEYKDTQYSIGAVHSF